MKPDAETEVIASGLVFGGGLFKDRKRQRDVVGYLSILSFLTVEVGDVMQNELFATVQQGDLISIPEAGHWAEVRRREKVIRIFPNGESAYRLIGAILMDKDEQWISSERIYIAM